MMTQQDTNETTKKDEIKKIERRGWGDHHDDQTS
jgi:hypothetical protein